MEVTGGFVIPGDRLGSTAEMVAGSGVCERDEHCVACVMGNTILQEVNGKHIISVVRQDKHRVAESVIAVGDIVLCRITRITIHQAHCEIIGVGDVKLREHALGTVRREDVLQNETDALEMHKCFKPGDIVKARVISLGDARQYYLTTAEVELGVRWAVSDDGHLMLPISWQDVECTVTKQVEPRKCAKPMNTVQS